MTDSTTPSPNSAAQKPFTIAVCGGGIGGLALAIGLLHHGVPVHVYDAAHAFAEIGASVAFGPNSIWAMSSSIPPSGSDLRNVLPIVCIRRRKAPFSPFVTAWMDRMERPGRLSRR